MTLQCIAKTAKAIVVGGVGGEDAVFDVTPDTPYVEVLFMKTLDGGQAALSDAVVASYTGITLVSGYANRVTCAATPFTSEDIDLILTLPVRTYQRMKPGHYKITDVVDNVAYLNESVLNTVGDLEIPTGQIAKVSSASLKFLSADTSYDLVVLSGTGFNTDTFEITNITGGVATLDSNIGTDDAGYIGGEGYLIGPLTSSGTTRKPFRIANDKFSMPNGAKTDVIWDEDADTCRARPLKSQQYDRCTCNLM